MAAMVYRLELSVDVECHGVRLEREGNGGRGGVVAGGREGGDLGVGGGQGGERRK